MPANKTNKEGFSSTRLFLIIGIVVVVLVVLWFGARAYASNYQDKIYPHIYVGTIDIGGLAKDKAQDRLDAYQSELQNRGVDFVYNQQSVKIYPTMTPDGQVDLAYDLVYWDTGLLVDQAFAIGRATNPIGQIWSTLRLSLGREKIKPTWQIDKDKIRELLDEKLSRLIVKSQGAHFVVNNGLVEVVAEIKGATLDYDSALSQLESDLAKTKYPKIVLSSIDDTRVVTAKELIGFIDSVNNLLKKENKIKISYKDKDWEVDSKAMVDWIQPVRHDDEIILSFGGDKWNTWIDVLAKEINVDPISAKFEMSDGRVTQFQGQSAGLELDVDETKKLWEQDLLIKNSDSLMLVVKETAPAVTAANVNDLGIKEIIGTGKSNFKGSPKNRRINITVGAKALDGILIKPDEEFSLIQTLGEIDAAHGYLPELVIKENKTIPEFGGGLCQIGTTTFRAAMASGLPIVERQNHSYRVVYYEPAGTDATIYNPKPDFRFLNDTGHYVLIQTRVDGDNVIFDFWGQKDGRKVEQIPYPPKLTNITSPGPAKYIATTSLKPGEKKKLESAHAGGTAEFTYRITYPSGEVKEKVFTSFYKPWREVWQIGVDPASPTIICPEKVPNCQLVPLEGAATPPPTVTNGNSNVNVNSNVNSSSNTNVNTSVVNGNVNINQ